MSTNGSTEPELEVDKANLDKIHQAMVAGVRGDLLRVLNRTSRMQATDLDFNERLQETLARKMYGDDWSERSKSGAKAEDDGMQINIDSPTTITYSAPATGAGQDGRSPSAVPARRGFSTLAKAAGIAALVTGGGVIGAAVPLVVDALRDDPPAASASDTDTDTRYRLDVQVEQPK